MTDIVNELKTAAKAQMPDGKPTYLSDLLDQAAYEINAHRLRFQELEKELNAGRTAREVLA